MIILGITGLIGSGKSVVRKVWSELYDLPTYDSDQRAKEIYFTPFIRQMIVDQLSIDPITSEGKLNKDGLRALLHSPEAKSKLEKIIHKGVAEDFRIWFSSQKNSPLIVLESAILFTSGFHKFCDKTIAVWAEKNLRKERVLLRDCNMYEEQFEHIVRLQKEEEKRQTKEADFVIDNNGHTSLIHQVEHIYQKIKLNN